MCLKIFHNKRNLCASAPPRNILYNYYQKYTAIKASRRHYVFNKYSISLAAEPQRKMYHFITALV